MEKTILLKLQGEHIRLVKSDGFVIDGRITAVYDNCIEFFSNGRMSVLSFDRISEIVPFRNHNNNRTKHSNNRNRKDFKY